MNYSNLTAEQQMVAEAKKFVNKKQRELTQAEYDALSAEEKNNGTIYFIIDSENPSVDSYTKSEVNSLLNDKVDKVNGKGLSTNDYTTAEKEKLANINLTNYATKDKEQAIDASETIYPLSKITSELELLLFRVDGQLHTGQYAYYVEAEGKYFVTDTDGKLFKSSWLHYNTQEEYYREVNTNIEFTKFLWVSNDNIIGYSTDGYLYYASRNSAFNGNFTQSEEIGTNLDFVNFYEFDGDVYCVTNNSVWMSQTFGQTWMRIKTGTFTNSMCGGGILAYTTSTKVYVECVGENDFKEYNLPITNGKTIYGKGLFICYTDGEIHVSYDGCQRWIEKQTFVKNGSVVYVSDLTDDLLIRYTKGIFGICNDNVWDLSFDFDNLIIISDYANDDYVSLWCNYSDNKYVYDVDSFGEFFYGEYLTTNIPQKVENNLAELHDVGITTPANGQILKYNSTTDKWENSDDITVDSSMSTTSTNPLQNKVITAELAGATTTTGNPITIESSESNLVECVAEVEAEQDLHGHDHPWVGGAGKNLLPMTVSTIKANNASGTWNGNVYSINNATVTILTDTDNNVVGIKFNGTPNATITFIIASTANINYNALSGKNCYLSGCPSDGGDSVYKLQYWSAGYSRADKGSGIAMSFPSSAPTSCNFAILFYSDVQANNLIFYPQCEIGDSATTFEPYENKSPITGQTEVVVEDVGKNLFDVSSLIAGRIDNSGNDYQTGNPDYRRTDYILLKAGTYIVSRKTAPEWYKCYLYDLNKIGVGFLVNSNTDLYNSFVLSNDGYVRIAFDYVPTDADCIQLELGNTVSDFEPYKGKTYTIQLGDTIYGGELDVLTGELRVTHGEVDLGDLSWTLSDGFFRTNDLISTVKKPINNQTMVNAISSAYPIMTWAAINTTDTAIAVSVAGQMLVANPNITNISDFVTAVTGQTLVYELAEPYTLQLTPQQIRLLKGTNNLSCNTGDLSIKYYPDNVLGQLKGDIEKGLNAYYDYQIKALWDKIEELQG